MPGPWNLTGTYFETCNCEAACPCVFLSPPSTAYRNWFVGWFRCMCWTCGAQTADGLLPGWTSIGECTVLGAWYIDQGRSDDVALDGLNVVLAVHSLGHMMQVQWKAALYLDDKVSEAQQTLFWGACCS